MNDNLNLSNENNDNAINKGLNYSTCVNQPSERSNNIKINEEQIQNNLQNISDKIQVFFHQ